MEKQAMIDSAKGIEGRWTGTVKQQLEDRDIEFSIDMELQSDGDLLTGTSIINLSGMSAENRNRGYDQVHALLVEGALNHNRFLFLTYENSDDTVLQFGNIILEFTNPIGERSSAMAGKFIGFGPNSKQLVSGEVVLIR